MARGHETTAPPGVEIPEYVRGWLGDRTRHVLSHGFSEQSLRLGWWDSALKVRGDRKVSWVFDDTPGSEAHITRRSLFTMAREIRSDQQTLDFFVHVLAWGSGTSRRANLKRLDSVLEPNAGPDRLALLREAASEARSGDADAPRRAYLKLIRPGGGVIPGLGPAFFTKFLYFAGNVEGEIPCLILDARVARSLYAAGWTGLPASGGTFSYNWYADTYHSYCRLLTQWAGDLEGKTLPDEIERALFSGGAPAK